MGDAELTIRRAEAADYGDLFTIQRAAFVDEAMIYRTPDVPALTESLDEFVDRLGHSSTLVALDDTRIVGAVSARVWRNEIPDVERLMVVPDRRGEGIATSLMGELDRQLAARGFGTVQLIVGELAVANRRLYQSLGYETHSRDPIPEYPHVFVLTMRKGIH